MALMKVIAIIPAAGLGTRMAAAETAPRSAVGKGPSKQFAELNGVPILVHTLRKFTASPRIAEIYVVLRKAEGDNFRPRLQEERLGKNVHLVEGGEHRQQSVANALSQVHAALDDIILVHDAVRPLVDEEITENAIITATVPRERVVLAQTPQGFRFSVLKKAFDEAAADGFVGTDEASLVERSGHPVTVVMGSARNIKITTPADMKLAEFYLGK